MVQEVCGVYAKMISCMPIETTTVTKAFIWMESPDYAHVCVLRNSMSMIHKVQMSSVAGSVWSPCRGQRFSVTFTFVPAHAGVLGNERTDKLTGLLPQMMANQWIMLTLPMPSESLEEQRTERSNFT